MSTYDLGRRWAIARNSGRDPERFLGELRHLPAAERREPGEWCELVVEDERRTTKWTLVILDDGAPSQL